ncbi:MAG: DEAD/DEAH box helicase family protein, partial [Solobacterium sp.]|nr:DEAD/DEAH box helicase family protein [Solobacterium sp.]
MRIPQKSEVRHVSGNIRDLESQLKQIIGSEKTDEKRIRRAVDNHTEASAMEILNRTDVEELNRSGERIRVNALRREGYTNIGRLVGTSYSKLEGLEGIGEQSASLIRRKVKQMYKELKEQVLLRIRTDNPEKEDRELVQALYIYLHSKDVRSEADKLYRAYHEQIRQDLKQAAVLEGSLRRLFAGRERKEEAAQAYEALRQLDTKAYRKQVMSLVQQHRSVNRTVSDICMEAFRRNAALYYAALSSFDDRPVKVDHYGLSDKLIESIDAVELSDRHLKAVLRPYQTFGVKYILHQKKVMLGDEMGLGKTVEAIAVMTNLAAEGMSRFLVVCPASVIVNWGREIRKFSDLEPRLIRGYDARGLQEWLAEGGAGITTYETIVRMSLPPEIRLDLLVADEAHYVKNPSALRTAAMRRLTMQADRILFMTGTPLENRVEEMSLLVGMLSHSTGEELSRYDSISSAPKYRRILAPVYLRRRREDVLNELPEKEEIENWVEMTE